MDYPQISMFIDGQWVAASDGARMPVLNPATEEQLGAVPRATAADLDRAAEAAARSFRDWRATPAFERYRILRKAAGLLRERAPVIGRIMTLEQGKPLAESRGEALACADVIDWMAEECRRGYGRLIPARAAGVRQTALRERVGPVAAFTPWNFPLNQAVRKISAALATGCTVVLKAPEETPASPMELVRLFHEAGVPAGALNLVFGDPAMVSAHLIAPPRDPQGLGHRLDRGGQAAGDAGRIAYETRHDGAGRPRAGDGLRRCGCRPGGPAAVRAQVPQRRPGS